MRIPAFKSKNPRVVVPSRKRHETPQTQAMEQSIADRWARLRGLTAVRIKKTGFDRIDFEMKDARGEVVCIAEAKNRPGWKPWYPSIYVSESKTIAARRSGRECYFLFRLPDGTHLEHQFDPHRKYEVSYGGRTDRGEERDLENVTHFPMGDFVIFG